MFNKKSQSGRSMVEMLGVLAIIGVLSIGGIAGYTLSMRKHRANQIVDVMHKYALIVYNACQQAIINGDIIGLHSCNSTRFPTYQESGLPNIQDIASLHSIGVYAKGSNSILQGNDKNDTVALKIYFNDKKICETASTITGIASGSGCHWAEEPHYWTGFSFN